MAAKHGGTFVTLEDLIWITVEVLSGSCVAYALGGESAVFVQLVVHRRLPGSAASFRGWCCNNLLYMSALSLLSLAIPSLLSAVLQ